MYKNKILKIFAALNNILTVILIAASVALVVFIAVRNWPYFGVGACVFYGIIALSGGGFAAWVLNRCLATAGMLVLRVFKLNANAQ